MFSGFTPAALIAQATPFATEVVVVALVVAGLSVALGLTGWVISKIKRAAR